jgi:anthranilate/para-aminobenzoate synthase component I
VLRDAVRSRRQASSRPRCRSIGGSWLRSTRCLEVYRAPVIPDLPPLQGGVMGYLGYDVVREVENLPDAPDDVAGMPDAVMSVIGSLAAFDHWRQRVHLIESVPVVGLDARRPRRPPTTSPC